MLKIKEVCHLFGVSPGWVYRRTRRTSRDRVPCVRLGRSLRFEAEAVKAYLDVRRTPTSPVIVDIAGGTGRVRRVRPMPRTQFQQGGIRKKGNRLYGYYRELIERPDGLVRCPGDFVSTDSPPRIGIGTAEWSRGLGVGANVFPQFPR